LKSFSEGWLARSELLLPISIGTASFNGCPSYLMVAHLILMVCIIKASLSAISSKIARKKASLSFLNLTSAFQS
jgi:hypothetical protein